MRRSFALAALTLLPLTGCVRDAIPTASGLDEPPRAEPWVQITVAAEAEVEAPGAAPARLLQQGPSQDRIPFEIGAGYGALSWVDPDVCRGRGLGVGYLHIRATFTPRGYVVRAAVASSAPPPPSALDCIADQLRQTRVPAFDGPDAKLSRTYFIQPSTGEPADTSGDH
jgi:hypothetical protein